MAQAQFDELIHVPARLSIMALLAPAQGLDFRFLHDQLQLSDSALSKHISALRAAGYVDVRKENLGRGIRRTRLDLTGSGLAAFEGHVAALEGMLHGAQIPLPDHHTAHARVSVYRHPTPATPK